MSRTVVVGAGLGGLVLAHSLRAQGEEVTVLEAAARPGGPMHSERRDGYLLESGPNSFIDRDAAFRELIDALGLTGAVVRARPEAKRRYLVHRGRLEALPGKPPEILGTPLLSKGGKLRALAEPLLARRGPAGDETLEEFGQRHFGAEATARLLDAVQTGIYAGRIGELSAQSTFPRLVQFEREARSLLLGLLRARRAGPREARPGTASFEGGMGQLVDALAAKLGDALVLDSKVESIERTSGQGQPDATSGRRETAPTSDGGWRIRTRSTELQAERLVLAVHPRIASELVRGLDAPLADALAAIPHAPMAVVHLGIPRERVAHPLDGFGFLAPAIENRGLLGCIFSSSTFSGRAPEGRVLLTVLLGGRRHPERVDLDDRALVLHVRDELRSLVDLQAEPELVHVVRHKLGIPQYTVGHAARMQTIQRRLDALPGLELCGWGYRGVGVLDVFQGARALAARLTASPAGA